MRILGNAADSQDALQDALMSIHRDLPRFEGRSSFSSWGYKVCLNAALMTRRGRVRIHARELSEALELGPFDDRGHHLESDARPEWQEEAQAHGLLERQELRDCLKRALSELPDSQRIVFVLKDLEDRGTDEIASHLQVPAATVRQRLHRARVLLQARLRGLRALPGLGRVALAAPSVAPEAAAQALEKTLAALRKPGAN